MEAAVIAAHEPLPGAVARGSDAQFLADLAAVVVLGNRAGPQATVGGGEGEVGWRAKEATDVVLHGLGDILRLQLVPGPVRGGRDDLEAVEIVLCREGVEIEVVLERLGDVEGLIVHFIAGGYVADLLGGGRTTVLATFVAILAVVFTMNWFGLKISGQRCWLVFRSVVMSHSRSSAYSRLTRAWASMRGDRSTPVNGPSGRSAIASATRPVPHPRSSTGPSESPARIFGWFCRMVRIRPGMPYPSEIRWFSKRSA